MSALQLTEIQQAIHELDAGPYQKTFYNAMEVLVEAGWENAGAVYDVEATLAGTGVPTWALTATEKDAKQLAFLVVERERTALRNLLQLALVNGQTAREFAGDLSRFFAEGYHVLDDEGNVVRRMPTDAWSKMVARTELSRASNRGQIAFYHAAGITKVQWSASLGNACCDECTEADGEVVNLGEVFPHVDVDSPPAHPNCACSTVAADADLGDYSGTDEQRARAARGGYSADEYEAKFGEKHPIDEEDA